MEKSKPLLLPLVVGIVAFLFGLLLFPSAHPYSGFRPSLDADAIDAKAVEILRQVAPDLSDMTVETKLRANTALIRQTEEKFKRPEANGLLQGVLPGYYWEVTFKKKKSLSLSSFSSGSSEQEQQQTARQILDIMKGDINLQFDARGNLMAYTRKVADSTRIASITPEEAWKQAGEFLSHFIRHQEISPKDSEATVQFQETGLLRLGRSDPLKFDNQKKTEQPHRTDYEFLWTTRSPQLNDKIEVRVAIAGNAISSAKIEYIIPEEYSKRPYESTRGIVLAIVYVVLFVLMLVAAFKRIRASEIGFRTGLLVGVVYAIALCYQYFIELPPDTLWWVYLLAPLVPIIAGAGVVLVWAVSESVVRETWKEKFVSMDLLRNGYLQHSYIGASLVRGLSFGLLAFGVWVAGLWLAQLVTPIWSASPPESLMRFFSLSFASIQVLTREIYSGMYPFVFFFLFLLPFLRQRISSVWLILPATGLLFGVNNLLDVQPAYAGVLAFALPGIVLVYCAYKFDVLAGLVGVLSLCVFNDTAILLSSGHQAYVSSGYVLLGLSGLALVWGFVSVGSKDKPIDFDSIAPAFARFISERQRLHQELEIARQVQMSFLPKANPTGYKLDIASRCAPALEVGGDYFDFIEIDRHRLGVAVGDVSGKGTQAAFFMTLTKGFLRALAHITKSPADVLTQVNKLFYENVDRGVFISLVYGIFDLEKHMLTVSRAGHNPLIVCKTKSRKVETVSPLGLALGLDSGNKFEKSIEEERITFHHGDLFVFYTDGFPEAMNKTKEEFGEKRLLQTVEKLTDKSAKEILEGTFNDMRAFTGKAPQHDDMTIVVVKVK